MRRTSTLLQWVTLPSLLLAVVACVLQTVIYCGKNSAETICISPLTTLFTFQVPVELLLILAISFVMMFLFGVILFLLARTFY